MTKIKSLTPEQEARMVEMREEYFKIGTCTDPADRPRAEAAITDLHELMGHPKPVFTWEDSPLGGTLTLNSWDFRESYEKSSDNYLGEDLANEVKTLTEDDMGGDFMDMVQYRFLMNALVSGNGQTPEKTIHRLIEVVSWRVAQEMGSYLTEIVAAYKVAYPTSTLATEMVDKLCIEARVQFVQQVREHLALLDAPTTGNHIDRFQEYLGMVFNILNTLVEGGAGKSIAVDIVINQRDNPGVFSKNILGDQYGQSLLTMVEIRYGDAPKLIAHAMKSGFVTTLTRMK